MKALPERLGLLKRIFFLFVPFFVAPLAGPQTASLQPVPAQTQTNLQRRSLHASVSVDADKGWTDTGLTVARGDTLTVRSTGTLALASGQNVTADGMAHLWRDLLRQYPLPTANTGALIGRIGQDEAAWPFALGSGISVPVRANGHLYLRANLSEELHGTGAFQVTLTISAASGNAPAAQAVTPLNPALFDTLPRRDDDGSGNQGDAVNLALVGTQEQLEDAFQRSGWFAVDADRNTAILHGLLATLSKQPYREVPMSTLYLFGRPQDRSYARGDTLRVAAERHHLRLWLTTQTVHGQPLWIGSATYDNGFARDDRNGKVTHSIAPDIDTERDFIRDSLTAAGAVQSAAYVTPSNPLREATTATGAAFHSDGRILVLQLQ